MNPESPASFGQNTPLTLEAFRQELLNTQELLDGLKNQAGKASWSDQELMLEQLYHACDDYANVMDQFERQGEHLGQLENLYINLLIELSQLEEALCLRKIA